MKRIIFTSLSLILFCSSLTILFLSMRAVMQVGGFCAEGGPYSIAVHCPKGVAYLTPLSIFGIILSTILYFYFSNSQKNSPHWGYFFWSVLFLALGWNFLEFGIHTPNYEGISWIICAIIFGLMGLGPFFFTLENSLGLSKTWLSLLLGGKNINVTAQQKIYESRIFLLILHFLGLMGGVFLGILLFNI